MKRVTKTLISLFMVVFATSCAEHNTAKHDVTVVDAYSGRRFQVDASRLAEYQKSGYITSFEYDTFVKPDRERVDRALKLRANGQYDDAIKELSAVGLHPKMKAERFCWIGTCLQLKGDYDGAIASYTESIAAYPKAWSYTYYARGISYMCKGNYVQAERDFHSAIEINPGDWDKWGYQVWRTLAELYSRTGDEKKSSDAMENARRTPNFREGPLYLLDPEFFEVYRWTGEEWIELKKTTKTTSSENDDK